MPPDTTMIAPPPHGPPAAEEVVRARILSRFPELVRDLGGDPALLLDHVGIALADIASNSAVISYRQVIEVLERAAQALGCPDLGLRLAVAQRADREYSPLGLVVRNARTLGEALDYVTRHMYAHTLAARVWMRRVHGAPGLFIGHDFLLPGRPIGSQAMEHMLLQRHLETMAWTNGVVRSRRVYFRHQALSPLSVYRRAFGCEALFDQIVDGVEISPRDLECPIVDRDPLTFEAAASQIDPLRELPVQARVRGAILQFLGTELCRRDVVAAELKILPHTLHRQLRAEGTSFQRIKDDVRRDLMLYYVRHTALDFSEISERLGFSEQSAMTHSCNRWFATSPTGLRMQEDEAI